MLTPTPLPSAPAATEVEAVLHSHPAVQQAAVFGVPSRVMGELVAAAVTLRPGAQVGRQGCKLVCASTRRMSWAGRDL